MALVCNFWPFLGLDWQLLMALDSYWRLPNDLASHWWRPLAVLLPFFLHEPTRLLLRLWAAHAFLQLLMLRQLAAGLLELVMKVHITWPCLVHNFHHLLKIPRITWRGLLLLPALTSTFLGPVATSLRPLLVLALHFLFRFIAGSSFLLFVLVTFFLHTFTTSWDSSGKKTAKFSSSIFADFSPTPF